MYGARAQQILKDAVRRDPNATFSMHNLCPKCERATKTSVIFTGNGTGDANWAKVKGYIPNSEQDLQETFAHHLSIEDLECAAAEGCHLCTLLCASLDLSNIADPPSITSQMKQKAFDPEIMLQRGLFLRIILPIRQGEYRKENPYYEGKPIYFELGRDLRLGTIQAFAPGKVMTGSAYSLGNRPYQRIGPQTSLWTGSDSTLDLAKEWLNKCFKTHKDCNSAYASASILPSRLLQLSTSGTNICMRICDHERIRTASANQRVQYCTLSHRWPKSPIVCLTKQNLESFMKEIPFESLPKTYQDAAEITQRLGYEYIWIDSLCIVQDDPADWEHESAIMGDIYRGSVLTIAGLAVDSAHDPGCFTVRNPLQYLPCELLRPGPKTGMDRLHGRPRAHLSAYGSDYTSEELHPAGELLSRGWVVQERVLSPRTLYFNYRGILWECADCYASPELPTMTYNGSMELSYSPKQAFSLLKLGSPPDINRPSEKFLSFHTSWSRLLGSYTQCELTMPSDKLVAIHGMVRKIEISSGMHAIAGLWSEILPIELLWHPTKQEENVAPTSQPYRAPSWSWAIIDAPVKNNYVDLIRAFGFTLEWKLKVMSHSVEARPNGQLISACITVEGPLQRISWPSETERDRRLRRPVPNQKLHKKHEHRDLWVLDSKNACGGEVWALHVAHGVGSFFAARDPEHSVYEDGMCDVGLLVQKAEGKATYRRIGYFEQYYWALDQHPIFAPGKAVEIQKLVMV